MAIAGAKIARVGPDLDAGGAREVDASGLYVTPGLIDIHVHVYPHYGEGGRPGRLP